MAHNLSHFQERSRRDVAAFKFLIVYAKQSSELASLRIKAATSITTGTSTVINLRR
ncbi:MAG TPA: hypothetical protein VIT88_07400 [Pyrinomonadaceae bacterium]